MSIVQISQIKHRRGTNETLPQLAAAELGWSVDTRQLYIGNGTLEDGAPEIGNTEILTQYSNIGGVTKYAQSLSSNTTANVTGLSFDNTDPSIIVTYSAVRANTADTSKSNVKTGTVTISQYNTVNDILDSNIQIGNVGISFTATQVANVCVVSATVGDDGANTVCALTYTINSIAI